MGSAAGATTTLDCGPRYRGAVSERFQNDPGADPFSSRLVKRRLKMRAAAVLFVLGIVAGLMAYVAAEEDGHQGTDAGLSGKASGATATLPCPKVTSPHAVPPRYEQIPDLDLTEGVDYSAVIETSCGNIELDLLEDKAPRTVANFIFLSRKGFFDGLTWHRIERNFVIQTGDPDGMIDHGPDGPGYTIPDELPATKHEYIYGAVAMANEGPGTGGSQFFIVVHDPVHAKERAGIDPRYSIFGRVQKHSYSTLDKIASMPVKGGVDVSTVWQPRAPVVIDSVRVRASS